MNFSEVNEIISKIEGVIHVKVVSGDDNLQEVHILASNLRSPKQIVRDIESSLIAVFDYRIDRKIISIAQIDTEDRDGIRRIKYDGVLIDTNGSNIDCTVKLNYGGEEYSSTQASLKTSANRRKVVAKATISAVEKILGQPSIFDIQDVLLNTSRDITFVSVIVNMVVSENEETMVGSAVVKNDINEAIVKATLDAINRRVQKNID